MARSKTERRYPRKTNVVRQRPTLLDFFCGAGGFSEGFRQQGFEIIAGFDSWEPAINTFNRNFGLKCEPKDILEFEGPVERIEELPDTDVIVGSPPCVSFSMSNKFGNADKSEGIRLVKVFLRVVAVKKFQKRSKLKAWYMENVPRTLKYLKAAYTFRDLSLSVWAAQLGYEPSDVAIVIRGKNRLIDAADFGVPQHRSRLFVGEIVNRNVTPFPVVTHGESKVGKDSKRYVTLRDIRRKLPSPYSKKSSAAVSDPNYPSIKFPRCKLSDHFYDTGVPEIYWRDNRYKKRNHPFMGRMNFPERMDRPSRTVVATNFPRARESLIYKCEVPRKGNGAYRMPTVREAAVLMSFPISFQFFGSENAKWRLVGNAVCPLVGAALGTHLRKVFRLPRLRKPRLVTASNVDKLDVNLNTYRRKRFGPVPRRLKGSRFRRHPFKDGNMAVALTNYDINKKDRNATKWRVTVTYGIGKGFGIQRFDGRHLRKLERAIQTNFLNGQKFIEHVNNGFSHRIPPGNVLQRIYEEHARHDHYYGPLELVSAAANLANRYAARDARFTQDGERIFIKESVPKKQLYALYAITKAATIANQKSGEIKNG